MFDNILHQSASSLLADDIKNSCLPGSILFSGPQSSGKLSCALETARVLSCREGGKWGCTCSSCLHHKAMTSQNILIAGPGTRSLEIAAARSTLVAENSRNSRHLEAARYLYLRAVRKLTARFNPVLWQGDEKLAKFSPILQKIEDNLEVLQPGRTLPDDSELRKILDEIKDSTDKLESTYLYDSLPVSQIRNISMWAHLAGTEKKKVLIIDNADSMADSARNALLKILEEPPEGVEFILITSRRNAVLPTILSRVRTYNFFERSKEQQNEVISRVFHYSSLSGECPETISGFLQTFLPMQKEDIWFYSKEFYDSICEGHVPDVSKIVSSCLKFSPRILFSIFIEGIVECQKYLLHSAAGCECSASIMGLLRTTLNSVNVFNQNPEAALEELVRSLMQVNFLNKGALKELQNN